MQSIAHLVSLRNSAGVEAHFAEFVRHAGARHGNWRHVWLNPAGAIHPTTRTTLADSLDAAFDIKRFGPIRLPAVPGVFRASRCRSVCRKSNATIGLVWNRTARSQFMLDALGAGRVIHWEHGRAWHAGRERERKRYLDRISLVIANSNAARRVLELRWGYSGEIRVCLNALRPSLVPATARSKILPKGRAIRLGAVARLLPVKGIALVLHALKAVRGAGLDAELHIAGEGADRDRLEALTASLGLSRRVRFHGSVEDMAAFYFNIDCLVHLPLTEAFGLVALEASAHGCPVIAASVDGLPEAVGDGVSGRSLAPSLPLSEYASLGSGSEDVPPEVYDPLSDRMQAPRLVDPGTAANAIQELFGAPQNYAHLSGAGHDRVMREFRFDDHIDEVLGIVDEFACRPR